MNVVDYMLDSFEKVRNVRISLEKATEVDFRKYDEAKRRVHQEARNIVLD